MEYQKKDNMLSEIFILKVRRMHIHTAKHFIVYLSENCRICDIKRLEEQVRIRVKWKDKSIISELNIVKSGILGENEVGLSEALWRRLEVPEGEEIELTHPLVLVADSIRYIKSKLYGNRFSSEALQMIINDISKGLYTDIQLSSFITTCAGNRLDNSEMISLTKAMIGIGEKLKWPGKIVVDKHCVGGLAGNRTTPIIVSIIAQFGLVIPKTSSRAITSAAGTADTMETIVPVDLTRSQMQEVVTKENGCFVWGGGVGFNPIDSILIEVERDLNLNGSGQLVASILSKKVIAGSSSVLIDIPVGPSAKVRSHEEAEKLKSSLMDVGKEVGLDIDVVISDGNKPIGRGIGPTLEMEDVLSVLKNETDAPQDLREHALSLAGRMLELSKEVKKGKGYFVAKEILDSGKAWLKFKSICSRQGGMKKLKQATYKREVTANYNGILLNIDNYKIMKVAKLAGAPKFMTAGVKLHKTLFNVIKKGDVLFSIYSESQSEMQYALDYALTQQGIVEIGDKKVETDNNKRI